MDLWIFSRLLGHNDPCIQSGLPRRYYDGDLIHECDGSVDVAVRALGGRRATEAGTASDEASEVVDALLPRVTRLSVRKRLSGRGGKSDREGQVGADEMGFDAMDADTLFGERSTGAEERRVGKEGRGWGSP